MKIKADYLFEASWEVCNKVGGIYTVLESKASQLVDHYGKNYFLIGPYFADKAKGEFRKENNGIFEKPFKKLEEQGIKCYSGKWLVTGEPNVILIDFQNFLINANQIKSDLWEYQKIDSLNSEYDFTEPVVWSWASGKLIEELSSILKDKKIVAHFHEWLSGAGLIYLKKQNLDKIGTVFSTHATVLGRTLAGNGEPLYDLCLLNEFDPNARAYQFNIHAKHQMEKAAASVSDIFTTLSEINTLEAEKFLNRKPDILLPNGLDILKFPTIDEALIQHRVLNKRLANFVSGYFFPYENFNLKNTLFYFIAGRYEFRNKGIDLFIKSLGKLNQELINKPDSPTIVAFLLIPSSAEGVRRDVLESLENYQDITDSLNDFSLELEENFLYSLFSGKNQDSSNALFNNKKISSIIEKKILKFKRSGRPPLSTHNIVDPNDDILYNLRAAGLENNLSDKVKIVFCPFYLTGSDGLINLDYREMIQACHFGVFPSYYEPWGYTPVETAALAVTSLTTDLAGAGRFIRSIEKINDSIPGIYILERFNKSDDQAANSLFKIMLEYQQLSEWERGESKIRARKLAALGDWKKLIKNYIDAHNQSL